MSAVTIHTPVFELPRGSATVLAFPGGRRRTPPALEETAAEGLPLRLTRRGRLFVTLLVATLLVAAGLLGARTALAGEDATAVSLELVTVLPGETLWSIAAQSSGEPDVRDRVSQIRELNALDSSSLQVGQELIVPAH